MKREETPPPRPRPRRGHHGGHHGGAWKVAYADFVTTMMALFIVLWIVSQNEGIRVAVARYFRDPGVLPSGGGEQLLPSGVGILPGARGTEERVEGSARDAEERALEGVAQRFRELLAQAGLLDALREQVQVEMTAEGLRVELVEREGSAFFAVGSATVLPPIRPVLESLARALAGLPNHVTIEGHTDSRPYHHRHDYSNWELSTDRAHAARRLLEAGGLGPDRVDRVVGHADRLLRVPDDPYHASNRRITIIIRRREPSPRGAR
jgi:chemotaxis protein MotB